MKSYVLTFYFVLICSIVFTDKDTNSRTSPIEWRTDFEYTWEGTPENTKVKLSEEAMLIARVLLSEDNRTEPWVMMSSIIVNRKNNCYNGKCDFNGVIHDPAQFTAVNGPNWKLYESLNVKSNKELNKAFGVALNVLVMGVPYRYRGITHAYYPEAMKAYGYSTLYPPWDSPTNRLNLRNTVDGWVYGTVK